MRSGRLALVVVVLSGGACGKRLVTPPPEAFVTLAGQRASYRDWTRIVEICVAQPELVQRDFESMNVLLANFLGQTSAGPDGVWAEEHVALLEEAQRVLPVALELQQRSLQHASRSGCRFEGLIRTTELTEQGLKRLAEAPKLLEVVKARKALAAWREALPGVQQAAREKTCATPPKPAKPPPGPVLFAAFEDEKGRTEWLFCDGGKVAASPGNVPAFEAPAAEPAKKPKKAPDPKPYLEAQAKFPSGEVNRAPRLPARRPTTRDDGPEPD